LGRVLLATIDSNRPKQVNEETAPKQPDLLFNTDTQVLNRKHLLDERVNQKNGGCSWDHPPFYFGSIEFFSTANQQPPVSGVQ
jgi:hypothetical protein